MMAVSPATLRHPREGGDPYARHLNNERSVYGSRIKSGMTEDVKTGDAK